MLLGDIVSAARRASRDLARAFVLAIAVGVCLLVAFGFLTTAAYMAAAEALGPVRAALCVAGFYALATAALAFALSRPSRVRKDAPEPEAALSDAEAISRLAEAFFTGFRAGRGAGK